MQLLVLVWLLLPTNELQKDVSQKNQRNWKMNWVLDDTNKFLLTSLRVIMIL